MEPLRHPDRVLRFGPFEADLQAGVLRKRGLKIKLQAQPFQVLAALLEKPGAVVTRDELRRRLWPDDTFVDFEHGVNAAVTRLRQALGDSSEKPRYIETLSKRGYRFIGEVGGPDVVSIEEPPSQLTVAPPRHPLRKWAMLIAAAAALGALVVAASYLFVARDPVRISHPVPLTAFQGLEVDPALSPDGEQVAFAWNGEEQDNFDIYVLAIGSGSLRHFTSDPAHDLSPVGRRTDVPSHFYAKWALTGRTCGLFHRQEVPSIELARRGTPNCRGIGKWHP